MTIELLKQNIEREKKIMENINLLYQVLDSEKSIPEKNSAIRQINALLPQLKMLNNALPALVENISFFKKINVKDKKSDISKLEYSSGNEKISVAVRKSDKTAFLENALKVNKESETINIDNQIVSYSKISNKFFRNISNKLVFRGYFDSIKKDLVKIASPLIINSYVSIMLFSIMLSFFFSLAVAIILIVLGFYGTAGSVFILIPILIFISFLLYPSSSRKSLEKEINQELPFLTIYMAAISTSGIEPSKIFSILVSSNDYPYSRSEIKKLNNYINFYGYDLVSALKKSSDSCASERLAQLFNGLSTSITSGGDLTVFLNKHAETLLFDYRLEREKYIHISETFMNIYISIVIAAPMILIMLFVLMGVSGFGGGKGLFNPIVLSTIIGFSISLINIMFLVLLNLKQPRF